MSYQFAREPYCVHTLPGHPHQPASMCVECKEGDDLKEWKEYWATKCQRCHNDDATYVISGPEFGLEGLDLGPAGTHLCGGCARQAERVGFLVEGINGETAVKPLV